MTVVVNGVDRDLAAETTVADVVALLRGPGSATSPVTGTAVALNETVVPRSAWAATRLGAGDRVEVLVAVQGG